MKSQNFYIPEAEKDKNEMKNTALLMRRSIQRLLLSTSQLLHVAYIGLKAPR